jgi:hypothetical protein
MAACLRHPFRYRGVVVGFDACGGHRFTGGVDDDEHPYGAVDVDRRPALPESADRVAVIEQYELIGCAAELEEAGGGALRRVLPVDQQHRLGGLEPFGDGVQGDPGLAAARLPEDGVDAAGVQQRLSAFDSEVLGGFGGVVAGDDLPAELDEVVALPVV